MTAGEILYRIRQQAFLFILRIQHRTGFGLARKPKPVAQFNFCLGNQPRIPRPPVDSKGLQSEASRLLAGEVSLGVGTWTWDGTEKIWHTAPDTGNLWPRCFFAKIDYREGNPTGDARILWEPSRLQQAFELALIASQESSRSNGRAARMANELIVSWNNANPPMVGANYISAMECALRLIAVCHAMDILRESQVGQSSWESLISIVSSHAPLIEKRLSLYSSTGNHTVAEAAGLVYAGRLFPEMNRAADWLRLGKETLTRLADSQILPDGGGVEQAIWYHAFNVQLLVLVRSLLEHYGDDVGVEVSSAAERGRQFLGVFAPESEELARFGDSDDGFPLSAHLRMFEPKPNVESGVESFNDSGYTVARFGHNSSVSMIVDHGELGMAPSFGHGHADAMGITLYSGSTAILVDPGTYTYTGSEQWRRYFRGTSAHNTVTVDRQDQAVQSGCFQWTEPYSARLLHSDFDTRGTSKLLAFHDGYERLGVRHIRGIAWSCDHWLLVWDRLLGNGKHELDLHWHLGMSPHESEKNRFVLRSLDEGLDIVCEGGDVSVHSGDRKPILGWYSPSYGKKEPISTIKVRYSGCLPHTFRTLFVFPRGDAHDTAIEDAEAWMASRVTK